MSDKITTTPQQQERLQEILLGYVEAAEAGAAPERTAFLAAHPEFAADIAEFLASYQQLNRMVTPFAMRQDVRSETEDLPSLGPRSSPLVPDLGQLGDYRLLREIGRGGMGIVYEAEQISLRRRVALKILPFAGGVDSRQLQRFRNEAEAAAHLHHSHIVPVFAVGSERGVHFYAMQHIEGQSLASLISDLASAETPGIGVPHPGAWGSRTQTVGALSTEHSTRSNQFFQRVAAIGKHTAEALEYAHQMGVVHRDIKPANLLLDAHGHVWITDFGLAQFQNQAGLTISGEVLGTLRYASPEQAMAKRGLVDHRTDIYSLGATLYELLTLQPVFDGKDRHILLQQIGFDDPIPPRTIDPTIPFELETIVLKALAKNPAERYGSAQELADDLQRFLDDQPILAKRPTLVDRARKWGRRHPSFVVAAVLLLAFGLIGFAVSTVLIAREQSATLAAYGRLESEEKQTKAALEKLASEEKQTNTAYQKLAKEEIRTKEAYKALAGEQARTKEAYDAEARLRDLAEWDFVQAQRVIDLVVQFSEGELAHNPGQQDVRRRLLATVLDYYENFLEAHVDDPDIQTDLAARRKRVALILTELASLRGTTLMDVIRDSNVRKDLELDLEQEKRIDQFVSSQSEQMKWNPKDKGFKDKGLKDKGPKSFASAAVVEKALGGILSANQMQRFQKIVLQVQQQGRYGFSDPKIVEALGLTSEQREKIRKIQNETHQAWADHLYTDKKISRPGEFWTEVQESILMVFEPRQRDQWQQMRGPAVTVDLREGYPWEGRNVSVPRPWPVFAWPHPSAGAIAVMQTRYDHGGSGFGHKAFVDTNQCYAWRGKEIPPTAFEIAVTAGPLSKEERPHLVSKGDQLPPGPSDSKGWTVLFRSSDPSVWNTDSPDQAKFAVPVSRAPGNIRYLRLKRMDTGEFQIIAVRHAELGQKQKLTPDQDFVWNGAADTAWGGRHLGIAETRSLRGSPQMDKGPAQKDKGRPPG